MSLNQYRYFLEIVRTGSIRKAADKLNVPPSSVSRYLQQLEHEMGAMLLERHAKGVSLTPAGILCKKYLQSVLFDVEALKSELDGLRNLLHGNVSIYSIEGVVAESLIRTITQFQERYNGVTFELVVTGAKNVAEAVISGRADIGIAFCGETHPDIDMSRRIPDPLAAAVDPQHEIAQREVLSFEQCLDYPIAAPQQSFGIRRLIDQVSAARSLPFEPVLETNSIEAIRSFARTGTGIALLPRITILRELAEESLVAVTLSDQELQRSTTDIMIRKNRRLPVAAREFQRALIEQIEQAAKRSEAY